MPLTELLRMISGEGNATQERVSNSSDPSPRPETDFCELVWENGHVTMQPQSSKTKKGPPTSNDYQLLMHKSDARDANGLKMNHSTTMDAVLGDFPSVVPSSETGLGQDADMVPWLDYPVEDSSHNGYNCDFLPQFSVVTMNDISTNSHLAFREKKSGYHGDSHHNSATLKNHDASKVDPHSVKYSKGDTSETPHFAPSSQNRVLRSGVSDITRDNVASRDINSSSLCAFTSSRLQKLDAGQPSTSSSFTNFPYFSRSGVLAKACNLTVNTSKRLENDERRCTITGSNPTDSTLVNLASACSWKEIEADCPSAQALPAEKNSELLPEKQTDELNLAQRTLCKEDVMKDTQQNHAIDATLSKVVGGERNMEPVVAASSVCSGNSVDRASDGRAGLKRKFCETTESEGPSEEVEEESVGAKKAAHARASSKRIRAAEVHNLSERRRRDRINEKMRALQELIPNCNKVDKASMLDEAIEYLKTLQLQLQMYSIGAGLFMQPMMVPPGMQPIHGAQMPHFSSMGLGMGMGMGMGMGFGTNMLDVNTGMKMMPFQSPHYPIPGAGAPFHGIPGSSLQPFGHPGQGLQMSMQRPPIHPLPRAPPLNISMGMNVSGVGGSSGASNFVSPSIGKDSCPQVIQSNIPNIYMNQAINQATKEGVQPFASPHDRKQAVNASGTLLGSSGTNNAA